MKVLVLYQFNNDQLLDSLCENLNRHHIEADSFNVTTWRFNSVKSKLPLHLIILRKLLFHYKLKLLIIKIFPFVLQRLLSRYTIVDLHFFGSIYFKIFDILIKIKKQVKITVWGSDFYRAPNSLREKQRFYYKKADCIHIGTNQMKSDFVGYFNDFSNKIAVVQFGIFQFDVMDKIFGTEAINVIKNKFHIPSDKLIVTCGYNGAKGQQHLLMLEAINNISPLVKKNLFLVIPMTYGANSEYIKLLENKLKNLDIGFLIMANNLSVNDICRLRLSSDITVNIQITDAFSASLQEHIYAKNVLIVGDWLPYEKLEEYNIFYKKTPLANLKNTIEDAINNYNLYRKKSMYNTQKVSNLSSWNIVIKDWIRIYSSLN